MGKELTEADMASYLVQFGVEGMSPRMIEAAYATTDSGSASISASQGTGFVYFKDWQHKVVAMVQANTARAHRAAGAKGCRRRWRRGTPGPHR